MLKIKPCPFCGKTPKVNDFGSSVEIDCCVFINYQYCDHLTLEQREEFNATDGYGEHKDIVREKIIKFWNKRSKKKTKQLLYKIDDITKWMLIDHMTTTLAAHCQTLNPDYSQDVEASLEDWLTSIISNKSNLLIEEKTNDTPNL